MQGSAAEEAQRAADMSIERAVTEGWNAAPQVVELTLEGLKSFKFDDGGGGGDSGGGGGDDDDEKERMTRDNERLLRDARAAFDDVLPPAGVGAGPLAVVLPPRPPNHALAKVGARRIPIFAISTIFATPHHYA